VVAQASEWEGNKSRCLNGLRRLLPQRFYYWKTGCGSFVKLKFAFMGGKVDAGQCFHFPGRNGRTILTIPTNLVFDTFQCLQYELLAYSNIRNQVHWIFSPNAIARSPQKVPEYEIRNRNIRIQHYFQNLHSCRLSCTPTPTRASIASSSFALRNFC
jgi:hypothetical protein